MTTLKLYNTLAGKKQSFQPLTPGKVGMYVCGPTVYDRPHLGNARSVVVYDVLFRLLRTLYGAENVTYVRNITDVDDKINAAAKENGETIQKLTKRITQAFHDDIAALNVLPPTVEPRATQHIQKMLQMIEALIQRGFAYVVTEGEGKGHVLFDVTKDPNYGQLSGRKLEELQAGVRIEVERYKRNPGDFVLWKPVSAKDDPSSIFDSPWCKGRPGWHIECSAMSSKYLGNDFDIHGGGADLKFPHHENEIAQSTCAHGGSHYATYWVHNGFLTVGGEKMSKSLGNFTTVREQLERGVPGEVIRYLYLTTHYRKPLDWNEKAVKDAKDALDGLYRVLEEQRENKRELSTAMQEELLQPFLEPLLDDMNVPKALALLHEWVKEYHKAEGDTKRRAGYQITLCAGWLGLLQQSVDSWFGRADAAYQDALRMLEQRIIAKKQRNFAEADRLKEAIIALGYQVEDKRDGTSALRRA